MTTYSITVILDHKWVRQFRNGKMNLCTSFGVNSNYSKVAYNVIATHEGMMVLSLASIPPREALCDAANCYMRRSCAT